MKGCIRKKLISSILSLTLCSMAIPMVSLNSSAANPIKPKIATSQNHTVVLKSDGSVWAVGKNEDGKLGVGKTAKELPKTATFMQCIDNTGAIINDAFDIACGDYHTAVLRGEGGLWQCGYNEYGQLGTGELSSDVGKTKFVQSKDSNKSLITDAKAVACSQHITAVIRGNGELWQCGNNTSGQLGTGNNVTASRFVQSQDESGVITDAKVISCSSICTAVIRGNGELWQCGNSSHGQLGTGESGNDVKKTKFVQSQDANGSIVNATDVSCGYAHTAVIRGNGELWQCGHNEYGQLGTGDTNDVSKFVQSKDSGGKEITDAKLISCDGWYTAVTRGSGELWMCGDNEYGQLSTGESGSNVKSTMFVQSKNANNNAITGVKSLASSWHHTVVLIPGTNENLELYGVGENNNGQLGLGEDDENAYEDQVTFIKSTAINVGKDPSCNRLSAIDATSSRNVTGVGEFQGAISVTIEWGALTYDYNAKWDPATQTWVQNGDTPFWKASTDGADKISVTNDSSKAYSVVLSFAVDSAYAASSDSGTAIEGAFVTTSFGNTAVEDNTLKLPVAAKDVTAYLKLSGMSDKVTGVDNLKNQTFGVVTATLAEG